LARLEKFLEGRKSLNSQKFVLLSRQGTVRAKAAQCGLRVIENMRSVKA